MTPARRAELRRLFARAKPRRVPKAPRVYYPKAIEAEYGARLAALVARTLAPVLAPVRAALPDLMRARVDSRQGDLLAAARRNLRASIDTREVDALARRYGGRVSDYNAVGLRRQLKAGLGADPFIADARLYEVLDTFAQRNVQLIVDVSERTMMDVDAIVQNAVGASRRWEAVALDIERATGMSEERCRLIARDQMGKLYGQINAERQQALGLTRFTWRTSGDERVRPEHRELDGRVFRFDDPPDDGKFGPSLPGTPIGCRCSAEPVLEDLIDGDAPETGDAWAA